MLNPRSYDGARVLEASGRPMLVIGHSYFVSIQEEVIQEEVTGAEVTGAETGDEVAMKLAEETTE